MDYTGGAADSPFSVYFFGDQTNSYEGDLTQLLHVKDCEVLSSFFDQAHYALRLEISRLSNTQRAVFPRFTCILDLLAKKSESRSHPALELSLLCLTQLARFIKFVISAPPSFWLCLYYQPGSMAMGHDDTQHHQTQLFLVSVLDPLLLLL